MKTCTKCGETKDFDSFSIDRSKKDDRRNDCKVCKSESDRDYRLKNRVALTQYFKKFYLKNKGKISEYQKAYYEEHKEYVASRQKKWVENNRDKVNAISLTCSKKYPEKKKARSAISHAIRDGLIEKHPCEVCGCDKSQAHHHKGYSEEFWLDVRWLCRKHHLEAERSNE